MRRFWLGLCALSLSGCATMPEPHMVPYKFPKDAYIQAPSRPYAKIGVVRSKSLYNSLDYKHDEDQLCQNYFNKAVIDLVKRAKEQKADAVIEVRSVTFMIDGKSELFPRAECSDDGAEGQVLVQAIAVKWTGGESSAAPEGLPAKTVSTPRRRSPADPVGSPLNSAPAAEQFSGDEPAAN